MTEIPSENILFAAFFLGFLFLFMYITCKPKSKSTDNTKATISPLASIPDIEPTNESNIVAEAKIVDDVSVKEPNTTDDLKVVEGIGPKIESLLHAAGITSMRNLANAETGVIRKILDDAGPRFRMHEPKTWSTQAKLIADESWGELKEYQDILNGGRDS